MAPEESTPAPAGTKLDPLTSFSPEDRPLLSRFLTLIRDNYKKADKAAHFIERKAGIANTCGMTNLRDVLSHLATLLDPKTPQANRADQVANAEEHLRRAIIEPYEIGLAALTEKFSPIYDSYREKIIPMKDSTEGFRTAPDRNRIEGRLAEINEFAERGKTAKGRNMWDDDWEEGVAGFVEAYDNLMDLNLEIEEWIFKFRQHQSSAEQATHSVSGEKLHRHGIKLHWVGILIGIAGIIIGGLFVRYTPYFEVKVPQPASAVQQSGGPVKPVPPRPN